MLNKIFEAVALSYMTGGEKAAQETMAFGVKLVLAFVGTILFFPLFALIYSLPEWIMDVVTLERFFITVGVLLPFLGGVVLLRFASVEPHPVDPGYEARERRINKLIDSQHNSAKMRFWK